MGSFVSMLARTHSIEEHLEDKRDRGGSTRIMHGRSRMTLDPRIPTMPDRARWVSTDRQTSLAPSFCEAPRGV